MEYRDTLNLPQTKFKMKANLTQKEPSSSSAGMRRAFISSCRRPLRVGPSLSSTTALPMPTVISTWAPPSTRCSRISSSSPGGWRDSMPPISRAGTATVCPSSTMWTRNWARRKQQIPILAKRGACRKYAEKWIKTQKAEFKRLGVLGDWDNPYLTMNFAYEAAIAREFNRFLLSGAVIHSKKPVYWCATCGTALAEAEVEYHDHTSPSIYVKFPVADDLGDVVPELAGRAASVLIWTTTPWTLPANLAVAFHPDFVYAAVEIGGEVWIMAQDLVAKCFAEFGIQRLPADRDLFRRRAGGPQMPASLSGARLAPGAGRLRHRRHRHRLRAHRARPWRRRLSDRPALRPGDPVAGGRRRAASPQEAGPYAGQQVPAVNKVINEDMRAAGSLVHQSASQPQLSPLLAVQEAGDVPGHGAVVHLHGEKRPARQGPGRHPRGELDPGLGHAAHLQHGREPAGLVSVPPAHLGGADHRVQLRGVRGDPQATRRSAPRIDELFGKEGADAWFRHEADAFLGPETACAGCGSRRFPPRRRISSMSGSTPASAMPRSARSAPNCVAPADLYLEGSDQHRGWFQSSLLCLGRHPGQGPVQGGPDPWLCGRRPGQEDVQDRRQCGRAPGGHRQVRRRDPAALGGQ